MQTLVPLLVYLFKAPSNPISTALYECTTQRGAIARDVLTAGHVSSKDFMPEDICQIYQCHMSAVFVFFVCSSEQTKSGVKTKHCTMNVALGVCVIWSFLHTQNTCLILKGICDILLTIEQC